MKRYPPAAMEAVIYSGIAIGSYGEDEMEFSEATL